LTATLPWRSSFTGAKPLQIQTDCSAIDPYMSSIPEVLLLVLAILRCCDEFKIRRLGARFELSSGFIFLNPNPKRGVGGCGKAYQ
jgi:hypothetical protein